jgi:hypothetical protein
MERRVIKYIKIKTMAAFDLSVPYYIITNSFKDKEITEKQTDWLEGLKQMSIRIGNGV